MKKNFGCDVNVADDSLELQTLDKSTTKIG